jgi:hypothetical protein
VVIIVTAVAAVTMATMALGVCTVRKGSGNPPIRLAKREKGKGNVGPMRIWKEGDVGERKVPLPHRVYCPKADRMKRRVSITGSTTAVAPMPW